MKAEKLYQLIRKDAIGLKFDGFLKIGSIKIDLCKANIISDLMQEWLEGWLKKNNIEYSANPNTQMPPDLYLDPEDLTHNLLEVKAFNYEATPAFDIAERHDRTKRFCREHGTRRIHRTAGERVR